MAGKNPPGQVPFRRFFTQPGRHLYSPLSCSANNPDRAVTFKMASGRMI